MLSPEHWSYYYLVVSFKIRGSRDYCFLLDHVKQADFFQHIMDNYGHEGREFTDFAFMLIDEESFDSLSPMYVELNRILVGD